MSILLTIASHGLELSPPARSEIDERVQGLETFFPRIVSCEVHIEGPGKHHRQGMHQARIILEVPARRIVISRRKSGTLHEALNEAFRAAGRRLEDHARRIRGDVKRHAGPSGNGRTT